MDGIETKTGLLLKDYDYEYLRRIYTGYRRLSQDIKNNFPKPITKDKLVDFFVEYIGEANLKDVMRRFDVPESIHKNMVLLDFLGN